MTVLRSVGLIGVGMLLAFGLLLGVGRVLAQGPIGGTGGMMSPGGMGAMHAQMHGGTGMPAECTAMMDDPAMMGHMMQMMHGAGTMDPAECARWMTEHGVPADVQARCLAHMAEYHPQGTPTPAR